MVKLDIPEKSLAEIINALTDKIIKSEHNLNFLKELKKILEESQ